MKILHSILLTSAVMQKKSSNSLVVNYEGSRICRIMARRFERIISRLCKKVNEESNFKGDYERYLNKTCRKQFS